MEKLLHYLWQHRLYPADAFRTTAGQSLEILHPGVSNTDAGPDFFNAKIKLDGELWAGNVEIHTRSSDWYKHHHETDKAYNSVILHVVERLDRPEIRNQLGLLIPQWVMQVPQASYENHHLLLHHDSAVPCLSRICEIPRIYLLDWICALCSERLERKSQNIIQLLQTYQNDWNEVFYITLARNFGFGINSDAFEHLAKSLPLKYILKHSNSPHQIEALLFGQAGMLEEKIEDDYYVSLQREYRFLSQKYALQPMESYHFKSLRIRPAHFPHIKIVQLGHFIGREQSLFSRILEKETISDFQSLFMSDVSPYWETHYRFGEPSLTHKKGLGAFSINVLLINTVVPILFAYGQWKKRDDLVSLALSLLESIPPEKNRYITCFQQAGMPSFSAADTQGILQLHKEYCESRRCLACRIGHRLMMEPTEIPW